MENTAKGVLITGASSGIGQTCALALDAHGFRVFAGVRKDGDATALRQVASDRLTPIFLDVTDTPSIAASVELVGQAVGATGLAGLVNNAGLMVAGPLEYLPLAELRQQIEVNVIGQLAVTQAFLPLIRQARGWIVNIDSVGGRLATPFNGAYSASKFALEALSDALRLELAAWGIHVAVIEPSVIATATSDKLVRDSKVSVESWPEEGRQRYGAAFETFFRDIRRIMPVTAAHLRLSPRRSSMHSRPGPRAHATQLVARPD